MDWTSWTFFAVTALPFVGIGIAILYAGYVAYDTRLAREAQAREPPAPAGPDPVDELARANAAMASALADAAATLASARDTLKRGLKG